MPANAPANMFAPNEKFGGNPSYLIAPSVSRLQADGVSGLSYSYSSTDNESWAAMKTTSDRGGKHLA